MAWPKRAVLLALAAFCGGLDPAGAGELSQLQAGIEALPLVAAGPSAPDPVCQTQPEADPDIDFSRGLPNLSLDASTPKVPVSLCGSSLENPAWAPLLRALQAPIDASLQRAQPYYRYPEPPRTHFHTGFDYHSHVHALWAQLYLARALGDKTYLAKVKAALPYRDLGRETAAIEPIPTNVYAAAWFALLLREYGRTETNRAAKAQIQKWEEGVRGKIFHFLAAQKGDEPRNYQVFSDGLHEDPALLVSLLKQLSLKPAEQAQLKNYQALLDPIERRPQTEKHAFFSRRAYLGLVDGLPQPPLPGSVSSRVNRAAQGELDKSIAMGRPSDLPDTEEYSALTPLSHLVGLEATSAWPQAKNPATCADWVQTAGQILARPDYWKTSFLHSHYIPQFLVFGFALQRGDL